MLSFVARRIVIAIPTVILISIFVFGLQKLLPGDPILAMGPDFLDQPVVSFLRPFADKEGLDLDAAADEFGAVAPFRFRRIGERHLGRLSGVPGVLGHTDLGHCVIPREWRYGGAGHLCISQWKIPKRRPRNGLRGL